MWLLSVTPSTQYCPGIRYVGVGGGGRGVSGGVGRGSVEEWECVCVFIVSNLTERLPVVLLLGILLASTHSQKYKTIY